MTGEPPIGVMIHGFSKEEAGIVLEFLEGLAGRKIMPISATGKEKLRVVEILNSPEWESFAAADPRIVMFLGFDDSQIGAAMKYFPLQPKPIFCSPTEQNLQWTFEYLVEHLLEERARFAKK